MSLEKDKYLALAPSHESQYTRYLAYSNSPKNSFCPRTVPLWNSLLSSVVSSKTHNEFKAHQCRTQGGGGAEGHVPPPPPPEEAVSTLYFFIVFFSCTAERKGGGTDRAVTQACN